MNVRGPMAYRFAKAVHWSRCLLDRLEPSASGLGPVARLASRVVPVGAREAVGAVAADVHGRPVWRHDRGGAAGPAVLVRLDDGGTPSPGYEIDGLLARGRRWVIDRQWIWTFSPLEAGRYRGATLEADRTFPLAALFAAPGAAPISITDIAGDACGGIWLLVSGAENGQWVVHLDRKGCRRRAFEVPCCAGRIVQLGSVERGRVLALLAPAEQRLTLMSAEDGRVLRCTVLQGLAPCWAASGLASDTGRRIALWGVQDTGDGPRWALFLLGPSGDVVDGPLTRFSPASPSLSEPAPHSAAVWRGRVWLAGPDGLWRVEGGDGGDTRLSSEGVLLTPRLHSPRTATSRGWLRAEVAADLPQGSALEAEFASTDDRELADRLQGLAADASMSAGARQAALWSLLDHPPGRRFVVAGPVTADDPVALPLFASQDEWLWLRLKIVTPPGARPRPLRELRVLYPDQSIVRHLPATFRNERHDPGRVLRRLVGVLETTTQRLDARIASIGSLMEAATAPVGWLDYMARWLDLPWDDGLPEPAKRRLVRDAGPLLDRRGTRAGLQVLLRDVLGEDASVRVVDLVAEHPPGRLGGRGGTVRGMAALPMLLAGAPLSLPIVGSRLVLGRTRLCARDAENHPLASIVPTLRIEVSVDRRTRTSIEPMLARLLAQYVPAGLRLTLRWLSPGGGLRDEGSTDVMVLGGYGPATLGRDSEIGRVRLGGPSPGGGDAPSVEHRLS